eukprot:Gb_25330 [translate_table: standard]
MELFKNVVVDDATPKDWEIYHKVAVKVVTGHKLNQNNKKFKKINLDLEKKWFNLKRKTNVEEVMQEALISVNEEVTTKVDLSEVVKGAYEAIVMGILRLLGAKDNAAGGDGGNDPLEKDATAQDVVSAQRVATMQDTASVQKDAMSQDDASRMKEASVQIEERRQNGMTGKNDATVVRGNALGHDMDIGVLTLQSVKNLSEGASKVVNKKLDDYKTKIRELKATLTRYHELVLQHSGQKEVREVNFQARLVADERRLRSLKGKTNMQGDKNRQLDVKTNEIHNCLDAIALAEQTFNFLKEKYNEKQEDRGFLSTKKEELLMQLARSQSSLSVFARALEVEVDNLKELRDTIRFIRTKIELTEKILSISAPLK